MAESPEFKTVVSCIKQLETALFGCHRDITHFLLKKGFITAEAHYEVLSPGSMWTAHQKAGVLVSGIMKKVSLSAQDYHTLVNHLTQSGKHYESIVAILNKEYARQQQAGDTISGQLPIKSYSLTRYRDYLKSYYMNNSIAYDDKLFIAPCSEFISLALVKKDKFSNYDDFSKSTFHGNIDEILVAYNQTALKVDALFDSDSRFILVEGPPGFGKSTLCWELCRKWNLGLLQDFKIVLQLKLREQRVQNAIKLQELFYHEDERLSQSVVKEVLEGEGVLLILDGFDEMPSKLVHNENSLIMKLINCKALPKATRLVTSRPSALHRKANFPRNFRHVEILGFTDDSKIKFAKIAFEDSPEIFAHFESFIFSNPVINSLMYVPINCAIITQVYQDIRSTRVLLPKTMTQLYTILSLILIRRHKIETGEWDDDSEVPSKYEDLSKEILADLSRIGKVACRGLFAEELQLVFSASDTGKGFNHLGLMNVSREMYVVSGAKVTYSFFHLSMQEFLAAWYASQHPELIAHQAYFDELNDFYTPQNLPAHLNAYVRFLAGFVGLSMVLTKPIVSIGGSVMILLHCFFEAQNPIQDQKLFPSKLYVSIQNPLDGYIFEYALTHTAVMWELCISAQNLHLILFYHLQNDHIDSALSYLQFVSKLDLVIRADYYNLCSEIVATLIPAMCRLSHVMVVFQSDYVVLKALQTLQTLQEVMLCFHSGCAMTNKGVDELITFFRESNTLETVHLSLFKCRSFGFANDCHSIIGSVLSCPTLSSFSTNIPFVASNFPSDLTCVNISIDDEYTVATMLRFLCCIADLCAHSSVQILTVSVNVILQHRFSIVSEVNHKFLSILNQSLHSKAKFRIYFMNDPSRLDSIVNNISVLSHSLGSKFEAQEFYIRRSQSLCDLVTPSGCKKPVLKSSSSCPDLFDLHRLHTLHPQLYEEIFELDSLQMDQSHCFHFK